MRATSQTLKSIVAHALLAGGVAVAGVGFGAATAHANTEGPFTWCPGQSMDWPTWPNKPIDRSYPYTWNMNVCHTW